MRIQTTVEENGCTKVEVIYPGGDGTPDRVVSCTTVEPGQQMLISLPNAHSENDVEVGEVQSTPTEEPQNTTEGGNGGEEEQRSV